MTLESPLDYKEIKPVNPKGNQSLIFIGRTDTEAEAPILWPPDVNNWLIGKDPDAGKDWRLEEKGMTDDEMIGWHYWLKGHEFEQAMGVSDGTCQGSLACCCPWGHKELDVTEWLNWADLKVSRSPRAEQSLVCLIWRTISFNWITDLIIHGFKLWRVWFTNLKNRIYSSRKSNL